MLRNKKTLNVISSYLYLLICSYYSIIEIIISLSSDTANMISSASSIIATRLYAQVLSEMLHIFMF